MPDLSSRTCQSTAVARRRLTSLAPALLLTLSLVPGVLAAQDRPVAQRATVTDSARLERMREQLENLLGRRVRIASSGLGEPRYAGLLDSVKVDAVVVDTITDRPQPFIFATTPPVLDRYRRVTVPIEEIRSVQVSRGTSRMRGVLWGGMIGAAIVGTLEALGSTPERNPTGRDYATSALRGAALGFAIGAPIGFFWGRERWTRVELTGR